MKEPIEYGIKHARKVEAHGLFWLYWYEPDHADEISAIFSRHIDREHFHQAELRLAEHHQRQRRKQRKKS